MACGHPGLRVVVGAAAGLALLLVTGCNPSDTAAKGSGQVVAKVNKEEISVHQFNYLLQRTPGLTKDNADAAGRQVLDGLISQELAIQRATELKLDRTPAVQIALDAARRDVLARAYLDKLGESVAKPTPSEISAFYNERPALFRQRKIYTVQEASILADASQQAEVRSQLQKARTPSEFLTWLRGSALQHQITQGQIPAESLPLELLPRLAALPEGQGLAISQGNAGVKVMLLLKVDPAPVDEATARNAIEQFIVNDRRRALIESEITKLRAAAKVETFGQFAQAPAGAAPGAAAAAPASAVAPITPAAAAAAASQPLAPEAVKKGLGIQ